MRKPLFFLILVLSSIHMLLLKNKYKTYLVDEFTVNSIL